MPTRKEPLIIPLGVPARYRRTWAVASGVLIPACALWIAFERSWEAFVFGGLVIVSIAWVWGLQIALRQRMSAPPQLVLTDEGISSPAFSLSWDRIESLRIGLTAAGALPALQIEPFRDSDVSWHSTLLHLNARLSALMRMPRIQILEVNVDRPLEELVREFEARAGRRLLENDRGSVTSAS